MIYNQNFPFLQKSSKKDQRDQKILNMQILKRHKVKSVITHQILKQLQKLIIWGINNLRNIINKVKILKKLKNRKNRKNVKNVKTANN